MKCLKSTLEILFTVCAVEIRQIINEISSFPEVLYKRYDLKNKQKKQSTGGVLTKDVLKNFTKFTDKIFAPVSFLIKLQAGNLKLSEPATGDVL